MIGLVKNLDDLVSAATSAQQRRDWPEALNRWEDVRTRFPDNPSGHAGAAVALQQLGRFDEADAVLEPVLERFPKQDLIAVEYARVAHRRSDWLEALRRWREVVGRFPNSADGVSGVGVALQLLGQLDEADSLLAAALKRFPAQHVIAIEYARVSHRRRDWPEALARWKLVMARFPDNAEGISGAVVALQHLNRYDELEEILTAAVNRFPTNASLAREYAAVAQQRRDWSEALRRWKVAQMQFPGDQTISDGLGSAIFHAKMATVDRNAGEKANSANHTTELPATPETSQRDLMMQFESLGSGCEFGLVQRRFGAEPLGLLRWGAIPAMSLVRALDARFDGVGNPNDIRLFEFGESKEYFFRDTKYSLEMHTFVPVRDSNYERVFAQQSRRARYLKDKLVEDLEYPEESHKIFVYKHHTGALPDSEALALHKALRRYGDHALLCVRPSDQIHPNRSVEVWLDGLLVAYIDGLSPTSNAKEIQYDSWLAVCKVAHAIWRESKDDRKTG